MMKGKRLQLWARACAGLLAAGVLSAMLAGCIRLGQPTASFTWSANPRPRAEITFINTSTDPDGFDDLREFIWDFGDNSDPADTMNTAHSYATSGIYTVKLTVTDSRGETDSFQVDLEVRSPIFADPVASAEAVGEGFWWDAEHQTHLIAGMYTYSEAEAAWIACYPVFAGPGTGQYMVPRNICGLIPIDFQPELDQPIVLRLSWRIEDSEGRTVYWYDYPTDFPIRDPSRVTGLVAVWDLWGQGWTIDQRSADNEILNPGRYQAQLTVIEVNSGDLFYWYFPFNVQWGGC
ncbi:MAG: PKD domain-containing protein [Candidatus Bipolaricaulia bacterium]